MTWARRSSRRSCPTTRRNRRTRPRRPSNAPRRRPRPVIRAFRRPTVGERAASFPDICRVGPPRRTRRPPRFRVPRLTTCPRRSRALLTERHKRSSGRRLTNRKSATPICPKSRCGECPPAPCAKPRRMRRNRCARPSARLRPSRPHWWAMPARSRQAWRTRRQQRRKPSQRNRCTNECRCCGSHPSMTIPPQSLSPSPRRRADGHRRRRQRSRPPRRASRKPKCRHRRGEP